MTEYSDTYWNNLLAQYQSGKISKEDQYKLEKRALDDPFLFDALEGFTMMQGDNIEEKKSSSKILTLPRMAAAASLVFLVAMIFLLKNDNPQNQPNQESIAMVLDQSDEKKEIIEEQEESSQTEAQNNAPPKKTKTTTTKKRNSPESNAGSKTSDVNKSVNQNKSSQSTSEKHINEEEQEDIVSESSESNSSTERTHSKIEEGSSENDTEDSESNTEEVIIPQNSNNISHDNQPDIFIPTSGNSGETADINDQNPVAKSKKEVKEEVIKVFYKVEPAIGIKDFNEYVKESIENRGLQQSPTQEVTIEFDINKDGTITNFLHIYNGCSECGAYAIYLLSGSGVWKTVPEGQEGRARYTLEF